MEYMWIPVLILVVPLIYFIKLIWDKYETVSYEKRCLTREQNPEYKKAMFEEQKRNKEIWDANRGRCELCGKWTKSVRDAHYECVTDDGCIVDGKLPAKYQVLLCFDCYYDSLNRGSFRVSENDLNKFSPEMIAEGLKLYKH